jgi:hypothetical protein
MRELYSVFCHEWNIFDNKKKSRLVVLYFIELNRVNLCAPEGLVVPVPLVTPFMLLEYEIVLFISDITIHISTS